MRGGTIVLVSALILIIILLIVLLFFVLARQSVGPSEGAEQSRRWLLRKSHGKSLDNPREPNPSSKRLRKPNPRGPTHAVIPSWLPL